MKISLITACYNSATTIRTAIESVLSQKGVDIEYIVVDGGSTDGTVDIIKEYSTRSTRSTRFTFKWISEKDRGMYDAINKGIKMATGDVIGILNADDVLATDDTLAKIAAVFEGAVVRGQGAEVRGQESGDRVDAVYADIRFVKDAVSVEGLRNAPTVRYCSAARWRPWMFRFAAMVPHPSFYVRRECFERLGDYSLDYRICADFELVLRFLGIAKLRAEYLPECVVLMRMGGASTAGWRSNVEINREDLRALRTHGIWSCLPLIYLKYLFKIWGFVFRRK
jgi:glycosyltransferase involved in cell wall biosynthesis